MLGEETMKQLAISDNYLLERLKEIPSARLCELSILQILNTISPPPPPSTNTQPL
jgi:hypothetical protein